MANVASAIKRIRSSEKRRLRNRYQHKTTKTAIKKILKATERNEALVAEVNRVKSMLDKLAKRRIIHPNKSARKKSQVAHHVNALKAAK